MWFTLKMDVSNKFFICIITIVLCVNISIPAVSNITAEVDGRLNYSDTGKLESLLKYSSLSYRKIYSDKKGDRLIFFGNIEAENNFKEFMLHEAYIRYKGPLSVWNLTLGRFAIPFGTIQSYISSRYLWRGLEDQTLGIEADDGLSVSGITKNIDYAFSITRGVGSHKAFEKIGDGLISSRIAIPFGLEESIVLGISGAGGIIKAHHMRESKAMGGVDLSINLSRFSGKIEGVTGISGGHHLVAAEWIGDFFLTRIIEINTGIRYSLEDSVPLYSSYYGLSAKAKGFTLRGGYTYDYKQKSFQSADVQLYYQYSWIN